MSKRIYFTGVNAAAIAAALAGMTAHIIEDREGNSIFVDPATNATRMLKPLDEIIINGDSAILLDNTSKLEMIGRLCHEANAAYCRCLGDMSQTTWGDAPDWQRKSAITGVVMHLTNPGASPSASHESWMKEKLADGWQYGEVKDAEAKTHPCIVEFDELPKEQQAKDYIFKAIVNTQASIMFPELALQL